MKWRKTCFSLLMHIWNFQAVFIAYCKYAPLNVLFSYNTHLYTELLLLRSISSHNLTNLSTFLTHSQHKRTSSHHNFNINSVKLGKEIKWNFLHTRHRTAACFSQSSWLTYRASTLKESMPSCLHWKSHECTVWFSILLQWLSVFFSWKLSDVEEPHCVPWQKLPFSLFRLAIQQWNCRIVGEHDVGFQGKLFSIWFLSNVPIQLPKISHWHCWFILAGQTWWGERECLVTPTRFRGQQEECWLECHWLARSVDSFIYIVVWKHSPENSNSSAFPFLFADIPWVNAEFAVCGWVSAILERVDICWVQLVRLDFVNIFKKNTFPNTLPTTICDDVNSLSWKTVVAWSWCSCLTKRCCSMGILELFG